MATRKQRKTTRLESMCAVLSTLQCKSIKFCVLFCFLRCCRS